MKAWSKKLISAVLLVSMLLSMLPLGAMAAEGEVAGETIETNEVEAAAPKTIQSTTVMDSTNTIKLTHANVFLVDGDSIRVMMLVDGLAEGYRWRYDLNDAGNRYSIGLSNDQYYINSYLSSSKGAYSLGWNELPVRVFTYETDDSGNPVASYDFTLEYYVAEKTDYPLGVDAIEKKVFNKNALSMSVELTIPQGLLAESWTAPLTISILDEDGTVYAAVPSNRTTRVYTNNNNIKDTRYASIYGDVNYYCYHTADYIFGHVYRGREMPVGLYNVCITDADGKQVVLLDDVIQIVDEPIIRIDYTNATVAGSTVAYVDLTMYAANEGTYSVQVLDADGTLLGTADYTSAMPTGYYNSENLYSLMRYQVTLNRAPEEYEELTIKVLDSRSAVVSTDIKHSYSDNMNILQWTLGSNHYANVVLETVGYATDKEYKAELLYEDVLLSTEYVLPDANGLFDIEFKDENGQVIALTEYAQYEVVLYDWDSYNGTWASYGNSVWFYNDKNEAQVAAVATMSLTEETQAVSGVESTVAEVSESSTVIKLDRISVSRRDGGIVFNVYVPQDTTDSIFQAGSSGFTAKLTSVAGVNAEIDLTVKGSTWNAYYFTLSGAIPETMVTGLYYVALCYNGKVLTDESGTAHLEGKTISVHRNANGSSSWSSNDYGYFVIAGSSYGNIPAGTKITAEFYPFGAFIPKEAFSFTFALDEYGYYGLDAETLSTLKPYQRYVVAYWMGDKLVGFDQDYALVVDSESFLSNEITYHTVTAASVKNGTLTVTIPYADENGKAPVYTEAYVLAEPAEGYRLKPGSVRAVDAAGNSMAVTGRGFLVVEDITVTGEFEKLPEKSYSVSAQTGNSMANIFVSDEYKTMKAGNTVQVAVYNNNSSLYRIDRVYAEWTDADGVIQTVDAVKESTYSNYYTFTMPAGNVTVKAECSELGHSYTLTMGSVTDVDGYTGGSLSRCSRDGSYYYGSSVYAGDTVYVRMISDSYYSTDSVDYSITDDDGFTTTGTLTQEAGPIYALVVPETGANGALTITATVMQHSSGYYYVNSAYTDGGYVDSYKSYCVAGEPLLLNVSLYNGYTLGRVYYTWTDNDGNTSSEITVPSDGGIYWITMPEGYVTLGAEFNPVIAPGGRVTTPEELVTALGGSDYANVEEDYETGEKTVYLYSNITLGNTLYFAGTGNIKLNSNSYSLTGPETGPVVVVESGNVTLYSGSLEAQPGSDAVHVEGGSLELQGDIGVFGGDLVEMDDGSSCGRALVVRNSGSLKVDGAVLMGGNIAAALQVETTGTVELSMCELNLDTSEGTAVDLDREIGSCVGEGQTLLVYHKYEYTWTEATAEQLKGKFFETKLRIYPEYTIQVDEIEHVAVTVPETGVYDTKVPVRVVVENGYAWEDPSYTLGYQQDGYYGMSSLDPTDGKNYCFYMPDENVTLELHSDANIVELEAAELLTKSVFSAGQEIWNAELADQSFEWNYLRFAWLQDGKTVFEQEIHTEDTAALGLINPGLAAGEYTLCLYYGWSNYYDEEYGVGKQTIQVVDLPMAGSVPADPDSLVAGAMELNALVFLDCPMTHIPSGMTLQLQQVVYGDDGSISYTAVGSADAFQIVWDASMEETQSLLEFTVPCINGLIAGEYRLQPYCGATALPMVEESNFSVPYVGDGAAAEDEQLEIFVTGGLYGHRNNCYDCVFPYGEYSVLSCEMPGAFGSGYYEMHRDGYFIENVYLEDVSSFDVTLGSHLYEGMYTLSVYDASYTNLLGELKFWISSYAMLCRDDCSWITPDGGYAPFCGDEMTLIPLNIDLSILSDIYVTAVTSLGEEQVPYTLNDDGTLTVDLSDVPYGMVEFSVTGRKTHAENSWSDYTLVENTILYRLPERMNAQKAPEAPKVGDIQVSDDDVITVEINHRETPDADVTMHIYRVVGDYIVFGQKVNMGKDDYVLNSETLSLTDGDYILAFTENGVWMTGSVYLTLKVPGKYTVTTSTEAEGLTFDAPSEVREGDTVVFTVKVEDSFAQYVSEVWAEYTPENGAAGVLPIQSLGGGRYSFVVPAGNVTIYAETAEIKQVESLVNTGSLLLTCSEWWLGISSTISYDYLRGVLCSVGEEGSLTVCLEQETRNGNGLSFYNEGTLKAGDYRLYVYGGNPSGEVCLGWQTVTLADGYRANVYLNGRSSLTTGTKAFEVNAYIESMWFDTLPDDLTVQLWQVGEEADVLIDSCTDYSFRYYGSKTNGSGTATNGGKAVHLSFRFDLDETTLAEGEYYLTICSDSVTLVIENPYGFTVCNDIYLPERTQTLYYISETDSWAISFQTENLAAGSYSCNANGMEYTMVVEKSGRATVNLGSDPLPYGNCVHSVQVFLNGTTYCINYMGESVTTQNPHYDAEVDGLLWVNGTCNGLYVQGAMLHSDDGVSTIVTLPGASGSGYYTLMCNGMNVMTCPVSNLSSFKVNLSGMELWVRGSLMVYDAKDNQVAYIDITLIDQPVLGVERHFWGTVDGDSLTVYPAGLTDAQFRTLKFYCSNSRGETELSWKAAADGAVIVDVSKVPVGHYLFRAEYQNEDGEFCELLRGDWLLRRVPNAEQPALTVAALETVREDDFSITAPVVYENGKPASDVTMRIYAMDNNRNLTWVKDVKIDSDAYTISSKQLGLDGRYVFFFYEGETLIGTADGDFSMPKEYNMLQNGVMLSGENSAWYDMHYPLQLRDLANGSGYIRSVLIDADGELVSRQEYHTEYLSTFRMYNAGLAAGSYKLYLVVNNGSGEQVIGWQNFQIMDAVSVYANPVNRWDLTTDTRQWDVSVSISGCDHPGQIPDDLSLSLVQVKNADDNPVNRIAATLTDFELYYGGAGNKADVAETTADGKNAGLQIRFHFDLNDVVLDEGTYILKVTGEGLYQLYYDDVCVNSALWIEAGEYDFDSNSVTVKTENLGAGTYEVSYVVEYGYTQYSYAVVDENGYLTVEFGSDPWPTTNTWFNVDVHTDDYGICSFSVKHIISVAEGGGAWYGYELDQSYDMGGTTVNGVWVNQVYPYTEVGQVIEVTMTGLEGVPGTVQWNSGNVSFFQNVDDLSSFTINPGTTDLRNTMINVWVNRTDTEDGDGIMVQSFSFFCSDWPMVARGLQNDDGTLTLYPLNLGDYTKLSVGYVSSAGRNTLSYAWREDGGIDVDCSNLPYGKYELWAEAVYEDKTDGAWTMELPVCRTALTNWFRTETSSVKVNELTVTKDENGNRTAIVTYDGEPASGVTMYVYLCENNVLKYVSRTNIGTGEYTISADKLALNGEYVFFFVQENGVCLGAQKIMFSARDYNTVTFKNWNGAVLSVQKVENGEAAAAPKVPARAGYSFIGWDCDFDCVTGNLTVNARYIWNSVRVTFYAAPGVLTVDDTEISSKIVLLEKNEKGTAAVTLPTEPTCSGYTFNGWYTDRACTEKVKESIVVSRDTVFYAGWTAIPYAIHVAEDENTGCVLEPKVDKAVAGEQVEVNWSGVEGKILKSVLLTYTLNDVKHSYNLSPEDDTTVSFTMPAAEVTLTAIVAVDGNYSLTVTWDSGDDINYISICNATNGKWEYAYPAGSATSTTFGKLTEGGYRVYASTDAEHGWYSCSAWVEVDGESDTLHIDVPKVYSISGTITVADGEKLPANLYLYARSNNHTWYYGTVDPNGSFEISGLPEDKNGTYTIFAYDANCEYRLKDNVITGLSDDVSGLEVTLIRDKDLLVTLHDASTTDSKAHFAYISVQEKVGTDPNGNAIWSNVAWQSGSGKDGTVYYFENLIQDEKQMENLYRVVFHYAETISYSYIDTVSDPTNEFTYEEDYKRYTADLYFSKKTDEISCVAVLDKSDAYPGDTVNLTVRYYNSNGTLLSPSNMNRYAVKLAEGLSLVGEKKNSETHSMAIKLADTADSVLEILMQNSKGDVVARTTVNVADVVLTAPDEVRNQSVFKMVGEGPDGKTIVLRNADTNAILYSTEVSGRYFTFEVDVNEVNFNLNSDGVPTETTFVAEVAETGQRSNTETVEVLDYPILVDKVWYSEYSWAEAHYNERLEDYSFYQYVDTLLYGYNLDVAVAFENDDQIYSVTYEFCGQEYVAERAYIRNSWGEMITDENGVRVAVWKAHMPAGTWGGSGLKNLTAKIVKTDGTEMDLVAAVVCLLVDPSGIITDDAGNPLSGVTVTCQVWDAVNKIWVNWDAEAYGQVNPQVTGEDGVYGWMVPEGTYRVLASKEGYLNYDSLNDPKFADLDAGTSTIVIPPARDDIDFSMSVDGTVYLVYPPESAEFATVTASAESATAGTTVTLTVTDVVDGVTLTGITVTTVDGVTVPVTKVESLARTGEVRYQFTMPTANVTYAVQTAAAYSVQVSSVAVSGSAIEINLINLDEDAMIFTAAYNDQGQMLGVATSNVTAASTNNGSATVNVAMDAASEASCVKVFLLGHNSGAYDVLAPEYTWTKSAD